MITPYHTMNKMPIYEKIVRAIAKCIVPISPPKYYSSVNEEIKDTWLSVGNGLRKNIKNIQRDIHRHAIKANENEIIAIQQTDTIAGTAMNLAIK